MQNTQTAAGASSEAIQFHYDVSNDFYSAWLDRTMTYSAAMFGTDTESLEEAQIRKIDHHLDCSGAPAAERLLDVGCGWGSLLRRARERGTRRAVGLTLSRAQALHVTALGADGIDVKLESWRDHTPDAPYDSIVCIGALEHFARLESSPADKVLAYRDFFKFCRRHLVPRGRLSLQTITWGTLRAEKVDPFITNSIFPESNLPYPWELFQAADRVMEIVQCRNDRADYARTCRLWQSRLAENRDQAIRAAGAEKVHEYERFLRMSAAGFETGALYLYRLTLQSP